MTEDTVEEIIYETGQRKQRLTKAVLSDYSAANGDGNQQDGEIKENESVCRVPPALSLLTCSLPTPDDEWK